MAALADLFARADGPVVERAGQVAASLPPLSSCADLRALGRRLKPPEPQVRAQVAELETQIQAVRLRAEAGQYSQALALMKPLREAARVTRYAPLEGHADYVTGLLQKDLEDLASAEQSDYAALLEAQAGGDDETVVRSASALAEIIGLRQERFDEGERWGRLAASTLERVEGDDLLRAEICFRLGRLLYEATRYPEALKNAQLSVDLRTRALGPEALPTADALYLVGEVAMEMGDLELALGSIGNALAVAERVLGERHPVTLSYRLAVASALLDAGKLQEAEQGVRGLDELILAAGGSRRSLGTLATVLSGIFLERGNFPDALAQARLAKDLFGTVDVYNEAAMWGQMGRVQLAMGHAQEAVESYTRSVAIIEKIYGPVHQDAVEFQGGLGEALLATGKVREALVVAERAVAAPHLEWQNPANAARARFVLARALWETRGDRERALALADEAHALFKKTGFREREVAEVGAWLSTRSH